MSKLPTQKTPAQAAEAMAKPAPVVPAMRAPEPGSFSKPQPQQTQDMARLAQVFARNAELEAFGQAPNPLFADRLGHSESNLPIDSKESIAIRESERLSAAEKAGRQRAAAALSKRRWLKVGVQPAVGGFVLHTEHFEGDVKVKETIQRNLTPLAAREKLAMHLAAVFSVF